MGFRLFIWPEYRAEWDAGETRLTERQAIILAQMIRRGHVRTDDLIEQFYGHREDGGPLEAKNVFSICIHDLRKRLAGAPVAIPRGIHGLYRLIDSKITAIADNIVAGEDHDRE